MKYEAFNIINKTETFLSVNLVGGIITIPAGQMSGPFNGNQMTGDILNKERIGILTINKCQVNVPEVESLEENELNNKGESDDL